MRRRRALLALATGALFAPVLVPTTAGAAPPPVTGSVACGLTGASTFKPAIGYSPGKTGRRIGKFAKTKWKLQGTLAGCTGTQSGGSPNRPLPIITGEVTLKARAEGHLCSTLTAQGLTIPVVKVRWFNAAGDPVGTTRGSGTATVTGLFDGTPYQSFDPPVFWPGYSPPGVITLTVSALSRSTAKAFPGGALSLTVVADETMADFTFPCSFTYPPVSLGLGGFAHTGEQGPSTIAVG